MPGTAHLKGIELAREPCHARTMGHVSLGPYGPCWAWVASCKPLTQLGPLIWAMLGTSRYCSKLCRAGSGCLSLCHTGLSGWALGFTRGFFLQSLCRRRLGRREAGRRWGGQGLGGGDDVRRKWEAETTWLVRIEEVASLRQCEEVGRMGWCEGEGRRMGWREEAGRPGRRRVAKHAEDVVTGKKKVIGRSGPRLSSRWNHGLGLGRAKDSRRN